MFVLPFLIVEGSSCGGHKKKINHGSESCAILYLKKHGCGSKGCVTDLNVKLFFI